MNLIHDIDPGTKDEMNVIIEIPKGSHNKYEIDKKSGLIKLDRANYSAAAYPVEYGFVPQTLWDDGDAIDVLLLATFPIPSGILVKVRPIALMEMIDSGESDYKIIGVSVNDRRWDDVQDIGDLNVHTLKEIQHFFETYKQLKEGDGNEVVTLGFKEKKDAQAVFVRARKMYNDSKK
ncbi:MAG TPA: inorganic diphosphatase [Candidatus Paceibacterota bacterium]